MKFLNLLTCLCLELLCTTPLLGQDIDKAIDKNRDLRHNDNKEKHSVQDLSVISGAIPDWAILRRSHSGMLVEIGHPSTNIMPGGNDYGVVSAITGAVDIPQAADANVMKGGTPGLIINSGLLGVARTASKVAPAVGVYGGAHMAAPNAQAWGANFTSKNYATSGPPPSSGYNGQVYGVEIDVNLTPPSRGWAGSNVDGVWITGEWPSKVDGSMNAVHIGAQGTAGWKNAIKTEHGAADEFAEIGKQNKSGASPSQIIHLISSDGKTDHHAILQANADGSVSISPNYFGKPGGVLIGSADAGHFVRLHPVEGISSPSIATRSILIDLDGKGAKAVSLGPPDSCGKGQRCLMVPN